MIDNTFTSDEIKTSKQKVKAIYPHITVSGTIDKPYYNIDWYDIEKQTMYRGFSSYDLSFVHKWLQEEFEVVETDIDEHIKRMQAENKQLQSDVITANQNLDHFKELWEADKAKAKEAISKYKDKHNELILREKEIQYEGAKAFAKFIIDEAENSVIPIDAIPNLVREWVGDKE